MVNLVVQVLNKQGGPGRRPGSRQLEGDGHGIKEIQG